MTEQHDGTTDTPKDGSGEMFDRIAERYDLLNRIISLGVDQGWRRRTVAALQAPASARLLDLATGTADLALQLANTLPDSHVIGLDPSRNMLDVGRRKITAAKLEARIELVEGDAQALQFEADSFDGITMAFGIRNVPDRLLALREMARVLRPGARACILELGEPRSGWFQGLARFHMHRVVPQLGAWLSGEREYKYLPQSIAAFPAPEVFCEMMQEAGLSVEGCHTLALGVCHLYVATKGT